MGTFIKLTFSLQSLGSQFFGKFHELAVFLSNLLIIWIQFQILSFFGFLFRLWEEWQKNEHKTAAALTEEANS